METPTRILFVDDEQRVLDGLRRMLRSLRRQWQMDFALGAEQALAALDRQPVDVIVTDIRMPGMNGVELLEEVRRRHPRTVRIVLSGQASREAVLRSVGPTHQYLPKPCDAETLKGAVGRLGMLRALLASEPLREAIAAMESLPSLPSLHEQLTGELARPGASIDAVAQTIARDVGMSGKILQMVSTGFFGAPRQVSDPADAVRALGLDIVRPLVLSLGIFRQFDRAAVEQFPLAALWEHSVRVAALARRICQQAGADKATADAAFLGGLFHDVGKVVLAHQFAHEYGNVLQEVLLEATPLLEAERQRFGATHAEVGAYLMGIWGCCDATIDALAFHHEPLRSLRTPAFGALAAVHAANALCGEDAPLRPLRSGGGPDRAYLERIGMAGEEARWRELADETAKETSDA